MTDGGRTAHNAVMAWRPARGHVLDLGLLALLLSVLAWLLGVLDAARWFSLSIAHRLQTNALLDGRLALAHSPASLHADNVWANNGVHQVWGLGIPLWRLPFELLARVAGGDAFPDRVALWLLWCAVAALVFHAARAAAVSNPGQATCVVLLSPVVWRLCRTSLRVYEETAVGAALTCTALGALLLLSTARTSTRWDVALGLAAGLAGLMRPTLALAGVVTLVVALRARRMAALPAWAVGLAAYLSTNVLRFGSPWETGQRLNVSLYPADQAAKLFGYPFASEPLWSALREWFGALVELPRFVTPPHWYSANIFELQSSTVRFRELYVAPFGAVYTLLGCAALVAVLAHRRVTPATQSSRSPMDALQWWCVGVMAVETGFYLWAPSVASRYLADVAAPWAWWLLLGVERAPERVRGSTRWGVLGSVTLLCAVGDVSPAYRARGAGTAAEAARLVEARPDTAWDGSIPRAYACGTSPASGGLRFNGTGWDTPGPCLAHAATTLLFPRERCIGLQLEPPAGARLSTLGLDAVRVRRGLTELPRVSIQCDGTHAELWFCDAAVAESNVNSIELVYVGFVAPPLVHPDVRPFVLRHAQVAAQPPTATVTP